MRRNRRWLGLALSPALLSIAAVVSALVTGNTLFLAFVFHPMILALVAFAYAWRINKSPRLEVGDLVVDAEGVRLHGQLVVAREAIRQGLVVPRDGRLVVRLLRRRRPAVELMVSDAAQGRAVLRALGLDASQTVADFRTMSRIFAKSGGVFALVGGMMAAGAMLGAATASRLAPGLLAPLFGACVLGVVVPMLWPTRVIVGADGIAMSWLGRKRFIRYADVVSVSTYASGFGTRQYVGAAVVLDSGEQIKIPVGQQRWNDGDAAGLAERIREAMETHRAGGWEADASILARRGRPAAEWVTALKAIGAGAAADLRNAAVPAERLWRIVEDSAASALARGGAAVARGPTLGAPAEQQRLRVAARATAAPKLRVLLERAASAPSDESLAEALHELDEAEAATERKSG